MSLTMDQLVSDEADVAFEEELARQPHSVETWWAYIQDVRSRKGVPASHLHRLHERALRCLPGSYKLWKSYLDGRVASLRARNACPGDPAFEIANSAFERALVYM